MPPEKRKYGDARLDEHLRDGTAEAFETAHVHDVYETIAPHFSATRYKAWPQVGAFVEAQPAGSVIVDVGAGNGKSLAGVLAGRQHVLLATDASTSLLRIAAEKGLEAVTSNALALPVPTERADCVISIAMLHHLSTDARRAQALREMVRVLRPGGMLLVYVWSAGQKRFAGAASQDVTVPWTLSERFRGKKAKTDAAAGGAPDTGPPPPPPPPSDAAPAAAEVHDRYYHLYREGELEAMLASVGCVEVVRSYYDCDNWCVEARKTAPVPS